MESDLIIVQNSIHSYWEDALPQESFSWNDLEDNLQKFIAYLLQKFPERLLQAAYRLDLPEKSFTEAFYNQDVHKITELILEREKKRLYFRKKYSDSQ
jgi:hypothetical protein